jgi:hypothetical protein
MEHDPVHHALILLNIIQIDVEIGSSSGEIQWDITTANSLCGKAGYTRSHLVQDLASSP